MFGKGLQYRTINSHRSAISAYHNYVDRKPVGKHPRVYALLTGFFNQRPPQPRYTFVWDVEIVLVYLKTNMSVNSQLSDKDLTHKLTVLMASSSASRASSLWQGMTCLINFIFINCARVGEGVRLHQESHIRHTHPNVCVAKTLDEYISRTESRRSGEECFQFLLSFVNHVNQ